MRYFLFCAIFFISSAVQAQSLRLERLNIMFEGNVSGGVYVLYCTDSAVTDSTVYAKNVSATTVALADEMLKMDRRLTPQQVEKILREKKIDMRGALNRFYKKNGCQTKQALSARKHFEMFNQKPLVEMQAFLADIENR